MDENRVRNMLLDDIDSGQYEITSQWVTETDGKRVRAYYSSAEK